MKLKTIIVVLALTIAISPSQHAFAGQSKLAAPATKSQACATNKIENRNAVQVFPAQVLKGRNAANFWPGSVSRIGIANDVLPLKMKPKFSPEEISSIDTKTIAATSVPPQLDKTAWELFYKARQLHLKAAMQFINKDMDKMLHDCQESQKLYQLALQQVSRGKHNNAFATIIYQEQNKTRLMEEMNPTRQQK